MKVLWKYDKSPPTFISGTNISRHALKFEKINGSYGNNFMKLNIVTFFSGTNML